MAGNSLNLIDMVKGYVTGDLINRVSTLTGESRDRTQLGFDAGIPGALSAFDTTASTTDGARRLASVVNEADEGVLSNIGSIFGKSTDFGSGALRSILGGSGLSDLTGNIERTSGLSGRAVTTLLGVLTPMLLGVLKRLVTSRGLDSLGLASLLAGQRENIRAAMPEGMRAGYREPIREEEEYRAPRVASRGRTTETYSAAPAEPRRSSLGWILPLALLGLLLGSIWHWSTRPTARAGYENKGTEQNTLLKDQDRMNRDQDRMNRAVPGGSLQAKYNSALESAREQGVQISSMTEENGKLIVRGVAPSTEVADRVRGNVREINPKADDIILDLSVGSAAAPSTSTTESAKATEPKQDISRTKPSESSTETTGAHSYVVKRGDTLGSISKQFYGNTSDYMKIFDANKSQLKDKNSLTPGQTLEIPMN